VWTYFKDSRTVRANIWILNWQVAKTIHSYQMCFYVTGTAISLFVFMLWTEHLVCVYLNLMPIGIVFMSYWANVNAVEAVTSAFNNGEYQVSHDYNLPSNLTINYHYFIIYVYCLIINKNNNKTKCLFTRCLI